MEELYNGIMTMQPRYKTFGETLFWTYATWQAIYTTANSGEDTIGKKFYVFRQIFYNKFKSGKQHITDLYRFNKLKMQYAGFCFYCYRDFPPEDLTADHVFPRVKGGTNDMDNIIFVCKSCNSSKGKKDLLEWFLLNRGELPSPFVLGHYFRQIYQYAVEHDLMAKDFEEVCQMSLPFNPHCLMILSNTQARQHYFQRAVREKENEDYGE